MKYNEQKRFGKVVKKLDWGVNSPVLNRSPGT